MAREAAAASAAALPERYLPKEAGWTGDTGIGLVVGPVMGARHGKNGKYPSAPAAAKPPRESARARGARVIMPSELNLDFTLATESSARITSLAIAVITGGQTAFPIWRYDRW